MYNGTQIMLFLLCDRRNISYQTKTELHNIACLQPYFAKYTEIGLLIHLSLLLIISEEICRI